MDIRGNPPGEVRDFNFPHAVNKYRELYDDITNNGVVLKYQDRHALGELAIMFVEMRMLRQDLLDNGEMLEVQGDRNVIKKKNPARDTLEKIRPALLRMMLTFQMAPSARKMGVGAGSSAGGKSNTGDGFEDV